MSSSLLSPPPVLRRSALFTMLKSISLLKPSLNPKAFVHCSNYCIAHSLRTIFLLPSVKAGHDSRHTFRLVPHAQASGGGRSVWEEAAEEFFRAKGQKPVSPTERSAKESSSPGTTEKGRAKPYERASANRTTGYNYVRSGRQERDDPDTGRKSVGSRSSDNGLRSRISGSQNSKAVSFAGREWGDTSGDDRRGGEGSRATSTWSKTSPERRSSRSSWGNNSAPRTGSREGPNGYRNDRGGGYGGERRVPRRERNEDGDEEGDEEAMDSEDWPKREAVNWRLEGEALYGVAPIRAALLAERRKFYTLYVQESLVENVASGKRKDKQAVNWILNRAHNLEMKVETVSKQNLNLLVDNRPHQGLVLDASPLELVPCEYLEKPATQDGRSPVWVALDEVIDPQNFGAILRSCHYLGATGVIVCAKNSAPLSGVVSKASAGALEVMEIQSCRNMMKFLDTSVLNGWRAVGASSEPRALPIQDLEPGFPTILVLGNEGRGLRTNVKRSCTELVSIKGFGAVVNADSSSVVQDIDSGLSVQSDVRPFGSELQAAAEAVDSLNVSVAAGILLHDLLSRSIQKRTSTTHSAE
ncbi:hypothetical protein M758_10G001700 [Ceratodon purpureus]|nr:hypothetical protein M758_10G001700 [Ceratodon purpureus]